MRILLLIPVWFALALIVPTVWVIVSHYRRLRGPHPVICPETGLGATIELDAVHSTGMRILGNPVRKVQSCSRWPKRQTCVRKCVVQFERVA